MPIQLDADLPAPLVPLAWLVGRWAGAGVVGYPTMEQDLRFGQEVTFAHTGEPFLEYSSRAWLLDDEGRQGRQLATETGYWRPVEGVEGGDEAAPPAVPPSRCCSRTPWATSSSTPARSRVRG